MRFETALNKTFGERLHALTEEEIKEAVSSRFWAARVLELTPLMQVELKAAQDFIESVLQDGEEEDGEEEEEEEEEASEEEEEASVVDEDEDEE